MARILFSVPPLVGHLNPALAVAAALSAAGHQVAWAVHARQIGDRLPAGAPLYPLDDAADDGLADVAPAVRGLESVRLFFEDYTVPMARRALPHLEAAVQAFAPEVIVADHQMPAAALVARKTGLPFATLVTTSASIQRMSPVLDAWVAEQYHGLQAGYLPPERIVERPDFSPYRTIVFSIEALVGNSHARMPAPYAFVGPAGGQGRPAIDFPWDWLQPGRPRLLISLGTVSRDRDSRFFEVMNAALRELPEVQAVMVAPAALAGSAPDNVLVREFVPQLELLPTLDGVVCHAGHNTVCEALSHDLPLAVAPIRDDQPVIARQVIDAGAGLFLRHGKVSPAVARDSLRRLLGEPGLRAAAARLGAELRAAPGAAGAARLVLDLMAAPASGLEIAA